MTLRASVRAAPRPGVVGAAAVLCCAVLLAPGTVALAAPSDQPGGTTGVLDSTELDDLQHRAADVQSDLQQRQAEVADARAQQAAAQAAADAAAVAVSDADAMLDQHQAAVAQYASAVYRDGGAPSTLSVLLQGGDPGEVVSALGYLAVLDRRAAAVLAAAEQERRRALGQAAVAEQALTEAKARATAVDAQVGELQAAAQAVTADLDRALGAVDRQLARLQAEQLDVNARTAENWRAYVAEL